MKKKRFLLFVTMLVLTAACAKAPISELDVPGLLEKQPQLVNKEVVLRSAVVVDYQVLTDDLLGIPVYCKVSLAKYPLSQGIEKSQTVNVWAHPNFNPEIGKIVDVKGKIKLEVSDGALYYYLDSTGFYWAPPVKKIGMADFSDPIFLEAIRKYSEKNKTN